MTEKSQENIEKEITPEEKEKNRQVALKNLKSSMWDYATPKFMSPAQYGQLSEYSKLGYTELIKKAPDQQVYEQLFLPQLAREGGAITSPYLQNTSAAILQESLAGVKLSEALAYAGVKGNYADKYVGDLGDEEAGAIISSAIQYQTDEKVKGILAIRQKSISGNLEKILAKEKIEAPKK
jgi:hypothetical protein